MDLFILKIVYVWYTFMYEHWRESGIFIRQHGL